MKRIEQLEELDKILWNIGIVERQVNQKLKDNNYYRFFGRETEFYHLKEIRTKALGYWKRRFNRVAQEIKY